jgi:hypothetical protein
MSSAGRAANSSGCVARPRAREIGLIGFAAQIRRSSLTGSYVMETAEHREPCESRGSRTVLGAPGGEIPPGDSTITSHRHARHARPMSAPPPIAVKHWHRSETPLLPFATERGATNGSSVLPAHGRTSQTRDPVYSPME